VRARIKDKKTVSPLPANIALSALDEAIMACEARKPCHGCDQRLCQHARRPLCGPVVLVGEPVQDPAALYRPLRSQGR
jgi:hypothetical protein